MSNQTIKYILVGFLALILIGIIYFFRTDLAGLAGMGSGGPQPAINLLGENISFNSAGKAVTIPPKFSGDVLDFLKKNMTQAGGLPLKIERKGNPLPFGIP